MTSTMPIGIYYARNAICSWRCQSLVTDIRLPARAAATLTTEWDAPRQRPTAYALAALFMLLLSNLFPFISMKVGGMVSRKFTGNSRRDVLGRLRQPWHLLSSFRADRPGFCPVVILLLVNRVRMPTALKIKLARILFQLKSWGWRKFFSRVFWSAS